MRTQRYANPIWMPQFDQIAATLTMRRGDYDAAIELIGFDHRRRPGCGHHRRKPVRGPPFGGVSASARAPGDLEEAEAAIERLTAEPVRPVHSLRAAPVCAYVRSGPKPAATTRATSTIATATGRWPAEWTSNPHIAMAEAMP